MLSKKNEQYIRSLALRKFRQKYNNFVIEGDKMVRGLLEYPQAQIERIFALPEWCATHQAMLAQYTEKVETVTPRELKKISTLKTPNQVLAVVKQYEHRFSPDLLETSLSLYLDGIQNPGNLGTILRTADWFGVDWVVCSPDCADRFSPKVVQATMGALFSVQVVSRNFNDLAVKTLNLPIYGAILKGENLFRSKLTKTGLIVIGNEGQGIRAAVQDQITHPVAIPPHANGGTESLNAAVATSIICATFRNAPFFRNVDKIN